MQAYEGYFENGQFYTAGRTIRIPERRRVFLTVLEEEPTNLQKEEQELRAAWLKKLDKALSISSDEEFLYISPRSIEMREPVNLTEEE